MDDDDADDNDCEIDVNELYIDANEVYVTDDEIDSDYINACKHNLIDTLNELIEDNDIDINWTDCDG